jgi:hypothetical protein
VIKRNDLHARQRLAKEMFHNFSRFQFRSQYFLPLSLSGSDKRGNRRETRWRKSRTAITPFEGGRMSLSTVRFLSLAVHRTSVHSSFRAVSRSYRTERLRRSRIRGRCGSRRWFARSWYWPCASTTLTNSMFVWAAAAASSEHRYNASSSLYLGRRHIDSCVYSFPNNQANLFKIT